MVVGLNILMAHVTSIGNLKFPFLKVISSEESFMKSCPIQLYNALNGTLTSANLDSPLSVDAKLKFHVPEIVLFNQDICTNLQLVELKEAEKQSLKESKRLEKEVAEVQELKKKLSTMTADEYFEKHPELKKKFDDEIRNDYWGY
ncbi:ATP synthase subunit d, mitochondrial [Capsicum annuum]|nr:ATP synthase subunit d, mitochondrial [Capsicum annuum]